MLILTGIIISTFTAPENLGTNPQSMMWLLPLTAAVAVAYKAMKLPTITAGNFIKEAVLLIVSIAAFMVITAAVLFAVARVITE
jgi:hypothetical protein